MHQADFTLRPLRHEDLPAIRRIGRRALPKPLGWLLAATLAPNGMVAIDTTGRVIGAMTVRTTDLGGRRWGILDWAVVEPAYQGQSIGTALGETTLRLLRDLGCTEVITTGVDGYNTRAWNVAYAYGLRYWSPIQQMRAVGWQWPRLLAMIPHLGLSTFVLRRTLDGDAEDAPDPALRSGVGAWLFMTLFLALCLLPLSQVRTVAWSSLAPADLSAPLDAGNIATGAAVLLTYLSLRTAAQWRVARALALPLHFRLWESGLLLATLLACAFGAFLPAFAGSVYIRHPRFAYAAQRAVMGRIMLAAVTVSLLLLLFFTLWAEILPSTEKDHAAVGRAIGLAFGITDTLLFFAPFSALPAGHLWRWRRSLWLTTTTVFLLIGWLLPWLL